MDASGKEDVFVETVGVGQAEIDIIDHADTIVLALMPGSGDSVQALKAGVMEIPDVIVVNKANHPLTDSMVREIRGVLALGPMTDWKVPILKTEATEGRGVEEVARGDRRPPRAHRPRRARSRSGAGATCATRCWASPRCGCGASWSARCAATRACRSCSTASCAARSTRRARRRSCCVKRDELRRRFELHGDLGELVIADRAA